MIEQNHIDEIRQVIYQMTIDGHLADAMLNDCVRDIEHELTVMERWLNEREGRCDSPKTV